MLRCLPCFLLLYQHLLGLLVLEEDCIQCLVADIHEPRQWVPDEGRSFQRVLALAFLERDTYGFGHLLAQSLEQVLCHGAQTLCAYIVKYLTLLKRELQLLVLFLLTIGAKPVTLKVLRELAHDCVVDLKECLFLTVFRCIGVRVDYIQVFEV